MVPLLIFLRLPFRFRLLNGGENRQDHGAASIAPRQLHKPFNLPRVSFGVTQPLKRRYLLARNKRCVRERNTIPNARD